MCYLELFIFMLLFLKKYYNQKLVKENNSIFVNQVHFFR